MIRPAVELVMSLSGSNSCEKVSFATEAGGFQGKGVPHRRLRPRIDPAGAQAQRVRRADELTKCENFIDRLLDHMCAA